MSTGAQRASDEMRDIRREKVAQVLRRDTFVVAVMRPTLRGFQRSFPSRIGS